MTLVERFIEIGHWPTSRKTLLWALVLVPIHLLAWVDVWIDADGGPPSESALANRIIDIWMAGLCLSAVLALRPALRGEDARWTAWLFVLMYASPVMPLLDKF